MSDSPPEEIKTAAPAAEVPAEKPAESPTAEQDSKAPPSLLDAVKAAIEPKKAETGSSAVSKSPVEEKLENAEPDDGEEFKEPPTKEELARHHSKTRRRMQWFMDQLAQRDQQLQGLQPEAESYKRIQKYVTDAGLNADEVNTGFEIMRLMKSNDPWTALQKLTPYVESLQRAAGVVLPNDLQEQARGGYISEQHAQELAQRRAREAALSQQLESERQARSQQAAQAAQQAIVNELSAWESSKAGSDPDYQARKSAFVQEALQAKWARGERPSNPMEARKQADDTLKEVETRLASILPKPVEIRPTTGTTSPAAQPQVASTLDAIRRAVGR